jgi:E3 ubiquitin-protein ligase NEDD4
MRAYGPQSSSENDITNILHETFSFTEYRLGEPFDVDLKPGGSKIPVTENNKHEYVDLTVHYWFIGHVRGQFQAFAEGFFEVIPKTLIAVFGERELELLIGGVLYIYMCGPILEFSMAPPYIPSQE